MRTLTLSLVALAVLVLANTARADGVYGHRTTGSVGVHIGGPAVYATAHHGPRAYSYPHHAWYGGPVVTPRPFYRPPVIVYPQPFVYPPLYPYYYRPYTGIQYYNSGVGISVGF